MRAAFRLISNQLEEILTSAEKNILIAVAWFTNENLFQKLIKLLQNGINVELVINNDNINNRIDGLNFNEFIKRGGKFYFADSSKLMHHKFIVIDDKIVVSGSYNWTYNAEFRNDENIIAIEDNEVSEQFRSEFEYIKSHGSFQPERIQIKPSQPYDLQEKKYLMEDFYYKSFDEEKKGNLKKSLEAIKKSKELDNSKKEFLLREQEIIKNIENPEYHYHIEDGQFSFDFWDKSLLGREGEIVKHYTDRMNGLDEFYILFIDGYYVECIGNIERSFPKDKEDHNRIKNLMLSD